MAKEINVAPVEPLIINNTATGVKRKAVFNTHSLLIFSETYGDLLIIQKKYKNKPFQLAGMLLCSAMKAAGEDVELAEVEALVLGGGMNLVYAVLEEAYSNFDGLVDDEDVKKKLSRILARQKQRTTPSPPPTRKKK